MSRKKLEDEFPTFSRVVELKVGDAPIDVTAAVTCGKDAVIRRLLVSADDGADFGIVRLLVCGALQIALPVSTLKQIGMMTTIPGGERLGGLPLPVQVIREETVEMAIDPEHNGLGAGVVVRVRVDVVEVAD